MPRAVLTVLLLFAVAPAAQTLDEPAMHSVIDAFVQQAAPQMLDAALTDFAEHRGDQMGATETRTWWNSLFQPTTAVGPLSGTIFEAQSASADGHPSVYYELEVVDPSGRQFPNDIYSIGAAETARLLDAQAGGVGWERRGGISDEIESSQSISWSECPEGEGGRFLAYVYTPLPEGNAEVQLYVGRSLGPSCTDTPHRFVAPAD